MGGNQGKGTAPHSDGFGDAIEQPLILVQSELVEFDVAAFAGECVWIGGERIDAAGIGEMEGVGAQAVLGIEIDLAEVGDGGVKEISPEFTVFEIKTGGDLIAGGDEDVEPGVGIAGKHDGVVRVGVGDADLAGFLDDFERGEIEGPVGLVLGEVF